MSADASLIDAPSHRRDLWLGAAIIFALTLIAYWPAIAHGGFIWDDDSYVTQNRYLSRGMEGLGLMWRPRVTPQYYPVAFSTFWIEYQLWGLNPTGYHVVNVLLHACNAMLAWLLARRLRVPWPWLIGAIFALHPVHVESVAWITERKNTLSALFYLLAAMAYLKFDDLSSSVGKRAGNESGRDSRWAQYVLALLFFVLAPLSKSVTCSLPAALILMMLWQRKDNLRLSIPIIGFAAATTFCAWLEFRGIGIPIMKGQTIAPMWIVAIVSVLWIAIAPQRSRIEPLLLFFIIGVYLALNTAHIERVHVGAEGAAFDFSIADRFIIASRALLFYPFTIIWPVPIMFIYPRWVIDDAQATQYLWIAAAAAIAVALIALFAKGKRGPGLALAFYAGTVFPALGFVNVYPMLFSFVADHFQYLASLGVIALIVAGAAAIMKSRPAAMIVIACIVLPPLAILTWRQADTYRDAETVWRDTLAKNEAAWMPHTNLGSDLMRRSEDALDVGDVEAAKSLVEEADSHLLRALELKPGHLTALSNLSDIRRLQGRLPEALDYAQQAYDQLMAAPGAMEMVASGNRLRSTPLADAAWTLGRALELNDRKEEAVAAYRDSIAWNPAATPAYVELSRLLLQSGRADEAAPMYAKLIELDPTLAPAIATLAGIRQQQGRDGDARDLFVRAVDAAERYRTADPLAILLRLVRLLSTSTDPNVRDTEQAVLTMRTLADQSQRRDPAILDVLSNTLAADGKFDEAIRVAEEAAGLAERMNLPELAKQIRSRAEQYRRRAQPPTPLLPTGPASSSQPKE